VVELERRLFEEEEKDGILGHYTQIAMSQATNKDVRDEGQYGGTVTALAMLALELGIVDGVLLTQQDERNQYTTRSILARTPEEIQACAGSKYTACPSLEQLSQVNTSELQRIAVVGRPCQITAIRKLQFASIEESIAAELRESVKLVIGLFCVWALEYRKFLEYLQMTINTTNFTRLDIPKDAAVITQDMKQIEIPYEELKTCQLETCDLCEDMTANLADISIGSTEWKEDWNTLIVRTKIGHELIDAALVSGVIKIQDLPDERIVILKEAVKSKKERVEALKEKTKVKIRKG